MTRTLLVTGGAGFIGSNFIRHLLATHPEIKIVNYDVLSYAGNLENLQDVADDPRYVFVKGDICDVAVVEETLRKHDVGAIVHFAAETHVDRSILGDAAFVRTNVLGTHVLLDAARRTGVGRFLHVSTDEVYGSLGPTGAFSETSPVTPNSPYAASKAGSDHLALAYHHTHGLPVIVTRCSNNYGPYQFPEKLIPLMVCNAIRDIPLPVYGDGLNVRDWLHVRDHCTAIDAVLARGRAGEVYNVGGNNEQKNIDIVKMILRAMRKPEGMIQFVKDRPGHDRRYAIDAGKIRSELGWTPSVGFEQGLADTVDWYVRNRSWWERVMSGDYLDYYRRNYDGKKHDR